MGRSERYRERALIECRTGHHHEAIRFLDKAIEASPGDPDLFALRASVNEDLGADAAALADYDKAIVLDPTDPTLFGARGDVKQRMGRFDDAIADYDKAISLDPGEGDYFRDRERAQASLISSHQVPPALVRSGEQNGSLCAECGTRVKNGAKFCTACGAFLTPPVPLPTSPAPVSPTHLITTQSIDLSRLEPHQHVPAVKTPAIQITAKTLVLSLYSRRARIPLNGKSLALSLVGLITLLTLIGALASFNANEGLDGAIYLGVFVVQGFFLFYIASNYEQMTTRARVGHVLAAIVLPFLIIFIVFVLAIIVLAALIAFGMFVAWLLS